VPFCGYSFSSPEILPTAVIGWTNGGSGFGFGRELSKEWRCRHGSAWHYAIGRGCNRHE
jgi:hypothetical protein